MVNINIRAVNETDYKEILDIYSYYITDTAVSFEYEVPTPSEFKERVKTISEKYPYIVAEDKGKIVGYAYGSDCFSTRAAYKWDSDVTVYIKSDYHGMGLGRKLYEELETLLKGLGYVNLYAIVTSDNSVSCKFHEKLGYKEAGDLPAAGFKLGRWHGVKFFTKRIGSLSAPTAYPYAVNDKDVYRIPKN